MKWSVEKVSPIIDAVIATSILVVVMWLLPDDWFADAKPVKYKNFIIAMVVFYHVGQWSGRRSRQSEGK